MEGKTLPPETGGCSLHPREFLWCLQPARLELTVQRCSSGSTISARHLEPPSHCDNSLLGNPRALSQPFSFHHLWCSSALSCHHVPSQPSLRSPIPTTLHLREDHEVLLQGPATHCCRQGTTPASQEWFTGFNTTSVHGVSFPPDHSDARICPG